MKKIISPLFLLLTGLLGLLGSGCKNKLSLDANGVPHTLVVGVYQGDSPADVAKVLNPIKQYLSQKLNMPVEFLLSSDYTSVIEAIRSNKVHMAYLSPFSYALATQNIKLQPLVVVGENGKPTAYRSLIITNPRTGLKTMDDVKARSKSLTLCFADPASTSGHLVPRAYLNSIGLDPDTSFKQKLFAGSHAASALSVKSGKVDVGCVFEYALGMLTRKGMLKEDDIVVLWTSDPIVEGPITMRSDINKDFTEKVRNAYLRLPVDAPELWNAYIKLYRTSSANMSYVPASDSMYEGVRKIAGGIKGLDLSKK